MAYTSIDDPEAFFRIKLYNGTDTTNFGLSGRVTTYGLKYS